MTIRTHWHRLREAVRYGHVYFSPPVVGGTCEPCEDIGGSLLYLEQLLGMFDDVPYFVMDQQLVQLAGNDAFTTSMMEMKEAGVLRLPFPVMTVEYPWRGRSHIVILRDLHEEGLRLAFEQSHTQSFLRMSGFDAYASVFRMDKDDHGDYVVASPLTVTMNISRMGDQIMYGHSGDVVGWADDKNPRMRDLVGRVRDRDSAIAFRGMCCAALLMQTEGVRQEVVETARLNRQRVARGRPAIPRHTYISIGRVYRSAHGEASDQYEPRRSPIPHWRRGHIKTYHTGPRREGPVVRRYIPARLVAAAGEDEPPVGKTYVVHEAPK